MTDGRDRSTGRGEMTTSQEIQQLLASLVAYSDLTQHQFDWLEGVLRKLERKAEALDLIERLSFDPRFALQGVQVHGLRSGEVNVSVRQGTNRTGESDPLLTEAVRALVARLEFNNEKL